MGAVVTATATKSKAINKAGANIRHKTEFS